MKNKYTLPDYIQRLESILNGTDHCIAGEVCEHLWNAYFKYGIYPDPFYIEGDVAIAEMINGRGSLKNADEMPELAAEIQLGLEDDIEYNTLSRLQILMLRESYHLIKNRDGYLADVNNCVNSRVLKLFANYSTYFGKSEP